MPARRSLARRAPLLGLSLLGVLAVSGCEKPVPEVTVTVGGKSVSAEAATYCFKGQSPEKRNCRSAGNATTEIRVPSTSSVLVDVPTSVADKGWFFVINNQRNEQPLHTHHARVPLESGLQKGNLEFQVYQVGANNQQFSAVWQFTLVVG